MITDIELLETMVKAIVSSPEAVKIDRKVDEMGVLLELSIDQTDMGTVIGKQGNTAKALRTILRAFGAKNNARLNLKIIEPEGSTRGMRSPEMGSSDSMM
ncbi:MAG: KH domain-containing protein [Patescibacteria group bacterium]